MCHNCPPGRMLWLLRAVRKKSISRHFYPYPGSSVASLMMAGNLGPLETPHHSPKPRHLSPSEGTPHALSISSTTDGYERDPPVPALGRDPAPSPHLPRHRREAGL